MVEWHNDGQERDRWLVTEARRTDSGTGTVTDLGIRPNSMNLRVVLQDRSVFISIISCAFFPQLQI
jgi:hypothetical protein